ncbi:hypothetical protein F471_03804 [Pseudomonas sp. URMO17WK12:I1]|uniref:hypothetical protein n=1 Tax=unclassified Pseudomonas TaxID=196821 RepID=UPI000489AFF1|nr:MULTISPECIES: hypothetical protein [unclassified Pseudomonas]PZW65325.1 hypothetical protein F471_03804 [Pseudomonas sp. URMO17WK12:I1]
MSTITFSGASPAPPVRTRAATTAEPGKGEAGKAASEPEQQPSVTVTLSEYAQKRAKSMREAFGKLREMQARQDESRKDAARQRLEDIKKRIEMFKQLVVALGPSAAKGALRQIKQLAQELGQAAAVLKEPSGGSASSVGTGAKTGEGEGTAAQETVTAEAVSEAEPTAEVAVEPEAEAETAEVNAETAELAAGEEAEQEDEPEQDAEEQAQAAIGQARHERNERQRRADAEELKKVAAQLKQLLAMVRSQISGKPDEDSKKLIEGIDKQLADVEKAAGEMAGSGLSLSVSVGATVSISV